MAHYNLNEQFLGSYLKPESEHGEYHFVRSIDANEMNALSIAFEQFGDFESICSLYEICEKNYKLIVSYHFTINDNYPLNHDRTYEYIGEVRHEIHRLLLNYLSSFRTFYDHLHARYSKLKKQNYSFFDDYKKITEDCYDDSFSYRFFYKLRNYIQHCGLPECEVSIYDLLNNDGNRNVGISTSLCRDILLNNYDSWGKVKNDLKAQPEHMEILVYLNELQSQIQKINCSVTEFEISLVTSAWKKLWELVEEIHDLYPNGCPFIGEYKKTDSGQKKILTAHFPIHTMLKFEEKCVINKNIIPAVAKSTLNKIKSNAKNYIELLDYVAIYYP